MADVFISYSRKDKEFVRRLHDALSGRNRDAWVDWEDIRPTEEFMQAIYGAIEAADTFIFVLTPDSIASAACASEIAHAAAQNKRLVPLVQRDVDASQVPEELAKLNWIFCREGDDFEKATEALIAALETDLAWVHAHTRLLTRAIDWERKGKNNSFVLRGVDLAEAERWLTEAGSAKQRQPTPLQTDYIITSRKATSRRQRITIGAITCGAVIALGLAILAWTQRNRAIAKEKAAIAMAVRTDFDTAVMYRERSSAVDARVLIHLARALRTQPDAALPRQYLASLLRDRRWSLQESEFAHAESPVMAAAFTPEGPRAIVRMEFQTVCVIDPRNGKPLGKPLPHGASVLMARFSADTRRILTLADDRRARVWDVATGELLGKPQRHELPGSPEAMLAFSLALSENADRLVTSADRTVHVWNVLTGESVGPPFVNQAASPTLGAALGAAFESPLTAGLSADGNRVCSVSLMGDGSVRDVESGQAVGQPLEGLNFLLVPIFSPDGRRLVGVSPDVGARLWDAQTGEPVGPPLRHEALVVAAVFSADSQRVVTASADKTARIWNAQTGQPVGQPLRHEAVVATASFSPDTRRLLTGSIDGTARVWDVQTGEPISESLSHPAPVVGGAFSDDGTRVITYTTAGVAHLWHLPGEDAKTLTLPHTGAITAATFSPDGKQLLTSTEKTVGLWDTQTGVNLSKSIPEELKLSHIAATSFGAEGPRYAADSGSEIIIRDAQTGKLVSRWIRRAGEKIESTELSADGRRLKLRFADKTLIVGDVITGEWLGPPLRFDDGVSEIGFSPNGRRFVTASSKRIARVCGAADGKPITKELQHEAPLSMAAFSSSGRLIATVASDAVYLWNATTGDQLGKVLRHETVVSLAKFSPDERRVISSFGNGARLWDVRTGEPSGQPLRQGVPVLSASFSSDSERVITTALGANSALIWDVAMTRPLGEPLRHEGESGGSVKDASFSADGRRVVTSESDDTAQIWDVAVDLKAPLPSWLPELAEALAGQRLNDDGAIVPSDKTLLELRTQLLALKGDNFWARFARWFFTRGPERTISPDSTLTLGALERLRAASAQKERPAEPRER
jgi:WD40 repeat protein